VRTPLLIGNWKMHKTRKEVESFVVNFLPRISRWKGQAEFGLAPQTLHLMELVQKLQGAEVAAVAQNCGQAASGAFTGETSPASLKDASVKWVLLGHSERRWVFHENVELVTARLNAALDAGLKVVLCVGERLVERKEGSTFVVLEQQLASLEKLIPARLSSVAVAYEPVWAIGTGETATPDQAQEAHAFIRQWIHDQFNEGTSQAMRILYGGSVKADNSAALMGQNDVDGLLVGGASLDPLGFAELIENGLRSST